MVTKVNAVGPGAGRLRHLFPRWASIGLFGVILATILRDAGVVMRYAFAMGVDGYYYVIQIAGFTTQHHFYFPTKTPLILWVLIGMNYLTHDPVWAVKFGSIFMDVALCLAVFAVVKSATRKAWLGVLASLLLLIPRSRFYLTTEYLNQLGAMGLLLCAGWSAMRAAQSRRRIGWLLTGALVSGAFFSHRSAIVLAVAVTICVLSIVALHHSARWKAFALLVSLAIWFGPAAISAQPFLTVPVWLQGQISSRPGWPMEFILLPEELMLAISALMVLLFIVWQSRTKKINAFSLTFGSVSLLSLLLTLNPFLNSELLLSSVAGRLRVMSYIQVALLFPALIWLAYSVRREAALYVAAIFLPLLILSAIGPLPHGIKGNFLERRSELIAGLKPYVGQLGSKSLVIAPHGDQFVVTAVLGIPSQQRLPKNSDYDRVYWLLNDVDEPGLSGDSMVLFRSHAASTILVEDSTFRRHWETMTPLDKDQLLRTNPNLARNLGLNRNGPVLD